MKKFLIYAICLMTALMSLGTPVLAEEDAAGKHIYVSADGSDSGDGSEKAPVKTLEAAQKLAREAVKENTDVTVHISGEHYITKPLEMTEEDSAMPGKTVKYIGDDTAVINGGRKISGWEDYTHGGNVIKRAKLDAEDIRHFWVNGERKNRAASGWIKTDDYWKDPDYVTGETPYESSSQGNVDADPEADGFIINNAEALSGGAGEQEAEAVWDLLWSTQRIPVEAIEYSEKDGSLTVKMKQPYLHHIMTSVARNTSPAIKDPIYIENVFAYLDEPGEFYFDRKNKYIYYYPKDGEDLSQSYAGISEGYIDITGTEKKPAYGISIENITFKYGTWLEPNSVGVSSHQADCLIKASNNSALSRESEHLFAQITAKYADTINISGNKFLNTGSTAVAFREWVSNSSVKENLFEDTSGAAVMVGSWMQHYEEFYDGIAKNIEVSYNTVKDVAVEFCSSVGIGGYYVQNMLITHNKIENAAYSGISLGWGWNHYKGDDTYGNEISYNNIVNVMTRLKDGAHIYTLGDLFGSVVKGNYCCKSSNKGNGGGGIYLDAGSANITFEDNVLTEAKYWLFSVYNNATHHITARNNYYTGIGMTRPIENLTFENNVDCSDGWTEEAVRIMKEAGVEKIPVILKKETVKKAENGGVLYEAENYNEGGEGVGYHKTAKAIINVLRPEDPTYIALRNDTGGHVIGDTRTGEWLEYDISVDKPDEYIISCRFSNQRSEEEGNPLINMYIDGEKVADKVEAENTGSWNDYISQDFAKTYIEAGEHKFRLEFANPGFSWDSFSLRPAVTEEEKGFEDISGHWAEDIINSLKDSGVIKGKTESIFAPDDNVSLFEAIWLSMRVCDIAYRDDDWQMTAELYDIAEPYDIYSGEGNMPAVREKFISVVMNAYETAFGSKAEEAEITFGDADKISQQNYSSIKKAYKLGLIEGDTNGNFRPQDTLTRAEAAAVINRMEKIK